MRLLRLSLLVCVLAILLVGTLTGQPQLGNQLPNPRLRTLMPCGGNAGGGFEVILTGSDLDEAEALVFSHPGTTAEAIPMPSAPVPDPKDKGKKQPPPLMPKFKVKIAATV